MLPTTEKITVTQGNYWSWRDQKIHYINEVNSQSPYPPLLFIHGFGASTDHWRKNVEQLGTEFEVWAIDLLGFGRSGKPDCEYSGDLWREQLTEFIETVIKRPVVIVGNSLGGYASLCVGAHDPQYVLGVILLNSAGPFSDSEPKPQPSPVKKVMSKVIGFWFRQNWVSFLIFQYVRQPSVIRRTLEKVYLDKTAVTDQLVEEIYRPSCDPGALQVFASVFRTRQGERVDQLLAQLRCPLLLLWGEGDPWMNCRQRSAKFHQHYSHLTEYFLNAGHCPHDEIPEQVNQLIRDWVIGLKSSD